MTANRRLPASAASVLLGTALLLTCAPKVQAAEQKPSAPTNADSELVQEKDTVTKDSDKEIVQKPEESIATEESAKSIAPEESVEQTPEKPASADQNQTVQKISAPVKNQKEEKADPEKIKSALDQLFDNFEFLKMPIDTEKGVLPDPSLIFANAYNRPDLSFSWELKPDVNQVGTDQQVRVRVTLPDFNGFRYDKVLSTTVHVWEHESDYAMVYGDPGEDHSNPRNTFVYYDVDQQKPLETRVFYGHKGEDINEDLQPTWDAMNLSDNQYDFMGYTLATRKILPPDYSDILKKVSTGLNTEEKKSIKTIFSMVEPFGKGNYSTSVTDPGINNFSEYRRKNMVYFVTSVTGHEEPYPHDYDWWGYNLFDCSNGNGPDPRYFIANWSQLPAGSTAEWQERPKVGLDGLENSPTILVKIDGKEQLVTLDRAYLTSLVPYINASDRDKIHDIDDLYKNSGSTILNGIIPKVTVGSKVPDPTDFIKYYRKGTGPEDLQWAILPNITKPGLASGALYLKDPNAGGRDLLYVLVEVVNPAPEKPKDHEEHKDPDPKPKPDPEPEPQPEPQPDPIPVPTPDPLPDIAEDPEKDEDNDKPEDKKPEDKKQTTETKRTAKKVIKKTSVVEKNVAKPVVRQKRAVLPQTGNKGLLVVVLGAVLSIIGLGLLRKKRA